MTIVDWRDAAPDAVQPLLLAERRRALEVLHWDLGPSLRAVEQARQRGDLAGLLLHDRQHRPVGWAFYILANRILQIGGLHAPTAGGLRQLLDRVLASPEAQLAGGVSGFLEATSPSLPSALTRLRFDLQHHDYLEASLAAPRPAVVLPDGGRGLAREDAPALVRLLAGAHAGSPGAQAFAPNARLEEWAHYAAQLLDGPAMGTWQPAQSFVVPGPAGQLLGAVVITEVARGVAHVAQIAVAPQARRCGLGRQLLLAAADAAAAQGARRMTLIVADGNTPARTLYQTLGFAPIGRFVFATRGPVPRTLGGVSIRASRPQRRPAEAPAA
jgi:ribosomal protein S18 acetylase RimI-like enzyme